jgi:hypothetical protein
MSDTGVFVAYSHLDELWLHRIIPHLNALQHLLKLNVWDDRKIRPGSEWHLEIDRAVAASQVAVCLVSADFLASDFCRRFEVPQLLAKRQSEGLLLLPVLLKDCPWQHVSWLAPIQMLPRDGKTVQGDFADGYDEVFADVARATANHLCTWNEGNTCAAATQFQTNDTSPGTEELGWKLIAMNAEAIRNPELAPDCFDEARDLLVCVLFRWFVGRGVARPASEELALATLQWIIGSFDDFVSGLQTEQQLRTWCLGIATQVLALSECSAYRDTTCSSEPDAAIPWAYLFLSAAHQQLLRKAAELNCDVSRLARSLELSEAEARQRLQIAVTELRRVLDSDLNDSSETMPRP